MNINYTTLPSWNPLVQIQAGDSMHYPQPVFCVHHAGGNVINQVHLARALGQDIPFFGIQAKGVNGKDKPHQTVEEMAECYIQAMKAIQPRGPYIVGGASGGGLIAYEIGQRLLKAGEKIGVLFFLDTFHPSIQPRPKPIGLHIKDIRIEGPLNYVKHRIMNRVTERQREAELADLLSMHKTIPPEMREWYLIRNHRFLVSAYTPQPFPEKVIQFSAERSWWKFAHTTPDRGWADLIPKLEIIRIPGDHDFHESKEAMTRLGNKLREAIVTKIAATVKVSRQIH
ncbi:MAG: thioesterase domain-containing protein [Chloroflexota bacterium]